MTVRPVRRIRWSTAVPQMVVLALSGFALIILSVPIAGDSAGDWDLPPGVTPAIVSVHSFTPSWRGHPRPWHVGLLWDVDQRMARPLIEGLEAEGDLIVGDNEPYDGALAGDTLDRHATRRGLANALIEIRQDLIADEAGAEAWAERFARLLRPLLADSRLRRIERHPTRTGERLRRP